MTRLVALFAMLGVIATSALAQSTKERVVELHPGEEYSSAIVIPAGSPLELLSLNSETGVEFKGRFTMSGTYLVDSYDPETGATFWPDRKSRHSLPYWRERGTPREIYLSNGTAFADAVVPEAKLRLVKAGTLSEVRGHATIIAEGFNTIIECDATHYYARFVAVVRPDRGIAALPREVGDC